jgi:hypothetical protein
VLKVYIVELPPIRGGVLHATRKEKEELGRYLLNLMFDKAVGNSDLEEAQIELAETWSTDPSGDFVYNQVKHLRLNQVEPLPEDLVYVMQYEMEGTVATDIKFISDTKLKLSFFDEYLPTNHPQE